MLWLQQQGVTIQKACSTMQIQWMSAHGSLVNLINFLFFKIYTYTFLIKKCSKDNLLIHTLAPWCWGKRRNEQCVWLYVCLSPLYEDIVDEADSLLLHANKLFEFTAARTRNRMHQATALFIADMATMIPAAGVRWQCCLDNQHKITKPKPKKKIQKNLLFIVQ